MKLANAIEGGLAGVSTISLLTNTLRKIDGRATEGSFFDGSSLHKRLKKAGSKKPYKAAKQYIGLAGELLGSTAFLGLSSLGKKKNAMLRGALLGTAAGLGSELLHDKKSKKNNTDVLDDERNPTRKRKELLETVARVGLYTLGGLVAGKVIQLTGKNKKKKRKN